MELKIQQNEKLNSFYKNFDIHFEVNGFFLLICKSSEFTGLPKTK